MTAHSGRDLWNCENVAMGFSVPHLGAGVGQFKSWQFQALARANTEGSPFLLGLDGG